MGLVNPILRARFDVYVNTTTATVPMSYEQWLEYHLSWYSAHYYHDFGHMP